MKIHSKKNTGFTLIELLVVVAIISLLSSIVLSSVNTARMKARDSRRMEDLHQIQIALNLYYSDNGHYPAGTAGAGNWTYSCNGSLATSLQPSLSAYIKLPVDPLNTPCNNPWTAGGMSYTYTSDGADKYDLVAQLEDPNSPYRCGVKKYLYHVGGDVVGCPPGAFTNQVYADH